MYNMLSCQVLRNKSNRKVGLVLKGFSFEELVRLRAKVFLWMLAQVSRRWFSLETPLPSAHDNIIRGA